MSIVEGQLRNVLIDYIFQSGFRPVQYEYFDISDTSVVRLSGEIKNNQRSTQNASRARIIAVFTAHMTHKTRLKKIPLVLGTNSSHGKVNKISQNITFLLRFETITNLQAFHRLFCGYFSAAKDYFTKQNLLFHEPRQNGARRTATSWED